VLDFHSQVSLNATFAKDMTALCDVPFLHDLQADRALIVLLVLGFFLLSFFFVFVSVLLSPVSLSWLLDFILVLLTKKMLCNHF
jgi:hypothetical protein